jgi:DNA-binding response OmpR family regulator
MDDRELLEFISVCLEEAGFSVDCVDGALYVDQPEENNIGLKVTVDVIA